MTPALPDFSLPPGYRFEAHELVFCDDDGPVFSVRRYYFPTQGPERRYLTDGRWTAVRARGPESHLYARPATDPLGGEPPWPYEWLYRAPYSYATPDDAIEAAIGAEQAWVGSGRAGG